VHTPLEKPTNIPTKCAMTLRIKIGVRRVGGVENTKRPMRRGRRMEEKTVEMSRYIKPCSMADIKLSPGGGRESGTVRGSTSMEERRRGRE
jgi:hypothetical protein